MKKQLFERYVELNQYRFVNKLLLKQKLITRAEYSAMNKQITKLETDLLVPRQSGAHRQRTLTLVK